MGLDSVEIVMEVEDEFGISIPDEHASRIVRVGELVQYVCNRLHAAPDPTCRSAKAFHLFRKTLLSFLQVPRSAVRPDARLEDLIPIAERLRVWQGLRDAGFLMPQLRRPGSVIATYAAVLLALAALVGLTVPQPVGVAVAICIFSLGCVVGPAMTSAWEYSLPAGCAIVRQAIVCHPTPAVVSAEAVAHDRERISLMIRTIITEQMGYGVDDVTEDKHFVNDLRVD